MVELEIEILNTKVKAWLLLKELSNKIFEEKKYNKALLSLIEGQNSQILELKERTRKDMEMLKWFMNNQK